MSDPSSLEAIIALSENADFARQFTPLNYTHGADCGREVAYSTLSYINRRAVDPTGWAAVSNEWQRQRLNHLREQAYDHMYQWFLRGWEQTDPPGCAGVDYLKPFWVALMAHTLIRDWEAESDPRLTDLRLLPALRLAADWLGKHARITIPDSSICTYPTMWFDESDAQRTYPACDLNLLIAPMYGFLYWLTGEEQYRNWGDELFNAGVQAGMNLGNWGNGKQFNQQYWWSFDYVNRWRVRQIVAAWLFDDDPSTAGVDERPLDWSGHGRHVAPEGGAAFGGGYRGSALSLEINALPGGAAYAWAEHHDAFNALPLTVSAWIKTPSTSGTRGIVSKHLAGSNNGWFVTLINDRVCARYLRDSSNYVPVGEICTWSMPVDNLWHHVAYVVDAAGDYLYVDGVLQAGPRPWQGTPGSVSTLQRVRVGNIEGVSDYFAGSIDEVRIYNRALTAKEIWTLYGVHLVAFFPLNEGIGAVSCATDGSGRPAPGQGPDPADPNRNRLCDASGNDHTGTISNVAWTTGSLDDTGMLGYAMSFNGSTSYVDIPHHTALNAYPLTLAAWVKTSTGAGGVVSKTAGPGTPGWNVEVDGGGSVCATYMKNATNGITRFCGAAVRNGGWHQVVFVVNLSGGSLYVDGTLRASQPWSGTAGATSSTDPLFFGRDNLAFYAGLLDDVRIYGRALTSEEISLLYQRAAEP